MTLTGTLQRNVVVLDSLPALRDEETSRRVRVVLEPLDVPSPAGPNADGDTPTALQELVRLGKARAGSHNRPDLYPRLDPILSSGTAQDLLDEDRGER